MAGMLPGVEAARRRRIYNGNNGGATASRRPSFCLYSTNNQDFQFRSHADAYTYAYVERNYDDNDEDDDEMLDAAAREAKKRLDLRLQKGTKSKSREGERSDASDRRLKPESNLYRLIFTSAFQSC